MYKNNDNKNTDAKNADKYILAFDTSNEVIAVGIGRLCGAGASGAYSREVNASDTTARENEQSSDNAPTHQGKQNASDMTAREDWTSANEDNQNKCSIEIIAETQQAAHRQSNTRLLACVDEVLREAGVDRTQIACVACGTGPGSFTGVRIALATAKGVASALSVALIGVSTLNSVAWGAWNAGVRGQLQVVADAMRHEVYPVRYKLDDEGPHRTEPDSVVKADVFAKKLSASCQTSHQTCVPLKIGGDALMKYKEKFQSASNAQGSATGKQRSANDAQECASGTQGSASDAQNSANDTQQNASDAQDTNIAKSASETQGFIAKDASETQASDQNLNTAQNATKNSALEFLPENLWHPSGSGLLLAVESAWQTGECNPFDPERHNPAFALPVYTRLSDAEENERRKLANNNSSNSNKNSNSSRNEHTNTNIQLKNPQQKNTHARNSPHTTMNDTAINNARGNAAGVAYKPLDARHAGNVAKLETELMGSDSWSESQVADELTLTNRIWWMALECEPDAPVRADAQLLGYAGALVIGDEAQLLKIAVDIQHRRQGIARALLAHLADDARSLGAKTMSLEVRESNANACSFYATRGFSQIGARPRYYSDGEGALIMQAEISDLLAPTKGAVGGMKLEHVEYERCAQTLVRTKKTLDARTLGAQTSVREAQLSSAQTSVREAQTSSAQMPATRLTNNSNAPAQATQATDYNTPVSATHSSTNIPRPLIFAIESSCDETAASIVDGEGNILSSVVASQVDFHARFGGVVPEIASRKHIEAICGVCEECFERANLALGAGREQASATTNENFAQVNSNETQSDSSLTHPLTFHALDAISATYAPGLLGALVVGVAFAKGVAWGANVPYIGVNHLEGHLYANKIGRPDFAPPALVSLVSGGNTLLVHMRDWGDYKTLGYTIDDAVGEAFDKVAKALGLGYPGGPIISKMAEHGDANAIKFPRAMLHSGDYRFSLSGLKTAVVTYINAEREAGRELNIPNICASFTAAVVDVQVAKAKRALQETGVREFCLGGGVAANPMLRDAYSKMCKEAGVRLTMPPLSACGDNAAMIALVALDRFKQGKFFPLTSDAKAHVNLDEPY